MLQWNPKLVLVMAVIVVVAGALGGFIESLVNGLTW